MHTLLLVAGWTILGLIVVIATAYISLILVAKKALKRTMSHYDTEFDKLKARYNSPAPSSQDEPNCLFESWFKKR